MPRFEVYRSNDALDWRWRLRSANGEVVASGEGYSSKQHAKDGVASVKSLVPDAETTDLGDEG
jgi:uncharacterized protein YegP (UPF0339 family)